MRLVWTRSLPEQDSFREQWDALALRMAEPEVFYTWEWAAAVARSYHASLPPWIAAAYDGDDLVGVAALAQPSSKEVVFLAANTADYCDFISGSEKRPEFVAQVLDELERAGMESVILANLPADSPTVAALKNSKSFRSFSRVGYACAQVRLGSQKQRQLLLRPLLTKKMLRRSLSALERSGPISLRHEAAGLCSDALNGFYATHVARFLATGRLSNLVKKQRRQFLTELVRLLAAKGWFELTSLCVGDRAAAFNYGFRYEGSWFWYQPTIVNELQEHSPGYCLLAKMIEAACVDPKVHVVDLGLGAEGYKERFANAERMTLHVTLSRRPIPHWGAKLRYRAAEGVKAWPPLEEQVRRLQRSALAGLDRVQRDGWSGTLGWGAGRVRRFVANKDEVRFYRWQGGPGAVEAEERTAAVTWDALALAAIRYEGDTETLRYLLRCSDRYGSGHRDGHIFLGPDDSAEHFAWVAPCEGFFVAELGERLQAPAADSVLIYDCWTPRELRGRGAYRRAIRQLAARLTTEGKAVWIFGSTANPASLTGIEQAGFEAQFSLVKRKTLLWSRTWKESSGTPVPEQTAALAKEAVR